ncbi:hypothetical protein C8R47DRAFT_1216429 [Mycena vitilis]|nr:hypothetical protein C8R47DRAFT_1216429 [Mycena vitilis]
MSAQLTIQWSIKRLQDAPKQIIDSARRGSTSDLKLLANFWQQQVPDLVSLGILDVFFHHLNADKAFSVPSEANQRSPLAECAFYALVGLAKSGDFLVPGAPHHRDPAVPKAWPGIFKWSAFFFKTRVMTARSAVDRRMVMDVIATAWYCLVRADGLREAIAATQGTVEIATQLWLLDDEVPHAGMEFVNIPCATAAFDAVLVDRHATDRRPRRRCALKPTTLDAAAITIHLDLLSHLSWGPMHPLRLALLQAGVIPLCTRAAGTLTQALNAGGDPELLNGIVSAFGYLSNCLQSTEGFTWVIQSVGADLLTALADASPHFARLDEEDYAMLSDLLNETLPMYLVYRSVIQAVDASLRRMTALQMQRINSSIAKKIWIDFQKLAEERSLVVAHAAAVKGKAATCDNCQKVDAKNTFQKCSGCSTTLYCSKECQRVAWKEGGHRDTCKMKQRERLEGKSQAISKSDIAFFHHLAARDARHHLPLLRRLARAEHPTLTSRDLLIRIDYTVVPPKYSAVPLNGAEDHDLRTNGSTNAEARNDAMLERVRQSPDRYRLIQSKIVNGAALQLVLSLVTGNFWEGGEAFDQLDEDNEFETSMDEVDVMMARTALNRFLVSHGEAPTF